MKIRKILNNINNELLKEIHVVTDGHNCLKFIEEGMGCVLCWLLIIRKPLAILHYLRNKGISTSPLEGESRLLDILGTEKFKQKVRSEVDMIRNTPKKRCFNCGKIVAMWMPYSQAALILDTRPNKEIGIKCGCCGVLIYFSSKEVRLKNKRSNSMRDLILATQLAGRLGYTHQEDNSEEEPPMEDYDDSEDDDNYDPDE
ncbi:MAG TPA: hypothetical protein VI146_08540 [Nitrososphaeraceae archaeon]